MKRGWSRSFALAVEDSDSFVGCHHVCWPHAETNQPFDLRLLIIFASAVVIDAYHMRVTAGFDCRVWFRIKSSVRIGSIIWITFGRMSVVWNPGEPTALPMQRVEMLEMIVIDQTWSLLINLWLKRTNSTHRRRVPCR